MTEAMNDPAVLRAEMVRQLRETEMVTTEPVAAAMAAVPRHLFAGGEPLETVYHPDATLTPKLDPTGRKTSVTSAPHIQGAMLEQANIQPGMNVLEIGSGGYNAALMAELVGPDGDVTSVDIDPEIANLATVRLSAAGYAGRVRVLRADAEKGAPGRGRFDRIVVTVGAWDIPPAWIDQLTETGRIVVPLRFAGITRLVALDHSDGELVSCSYRLGSFVPMQGAGAYDTELLPVTDGVAVRVDEPTPPPLDAAGLAQSMTGPKREFWSGAAYDLPDEQQLFLLTGDLTAPMRMVQATEDAVKRGLLTPAAVRGAPTLIDGGSLAYQITRPTPDTGGYESGVATWGPQGPKLADRYLDLQRRWAQNYRRRNTATITFRPHRAGGGPVNDSSWHTVKRHGTVTVTWPPASRPG